MQSRAVSQKLKMDHAGYHTLLWLLLPPPPLPPPSPTCILFSACVLFFSDCCFCFSLLCFALRCFTLCLLILCLVSFPRFWCVFLGTPKRSRKKDISKYFCVNLLLLWSLYLVFCLRHHRRYILSHHRDKKSGFNKFCQRQKPIVLLQLVN